MLESLFEENLELTGEYLKAQEDSKFTAELEGKVEEILQYISMTVTYKDSNFRRVNKLDKLAVELEEIIYNRLGVPIHLIGGEGIAYSIPFVGVNSSIIDNYRKEIVLYIEKLRAFRCGKTGKCNYKNIETTKIRDEKELFENNEKIIDYLGDGTTIMNEIYGTKGITLDSKRIKITGLERLKNNKKAFIIFMGFKTLLTLGKTTREIVAILLHEIGHIFNDLIYADIYTRTALPAINSFMGEKIPEKKVIKAYKTLTGKEATLKEALEKLPIELLRDVELAHGSVSSFYNSEIMADTFAAKFGYGKDVVDALNHIVIKQERLQYPLLTLLVKLTILLFLITLFLVLVSVAGVLIVLIYPELILRIIYMLFFTDLADNIQNIDDPHEQSYSRTRRMKLELIRQLRNKEITKDRRALIKMIIELDETLESIGIDKQTFQILTTVLKGHGQEIGYHELYQRIEQISENDLHLLSFKLEEVKSNKR